MNPRAVPALRSRLGPARPADGAAARRGRCLRHRSRHPAADHARHWLPELAAADLITVDYDDAPTAPPTGQAAGIGWAQFTWTDLDTALRTGRIVGSAGQLRLLRAAASFADGQPVALGDLAAITDRDALRLLLAAVAHAGGSHEHRATDPDGHLGDPLPPLVPWPPRD